MEKKKTFVLILMAVIIGIMYGIYNIDAKKEIKREYRNNKMDAQKFKKEYESLNGKKRKGQDYTNLEVKIDKENPIVYASKKQILDIFDHGTKVIYFGFPDCPWCRNIVPVLIENAKEENVKEIYYYNAKEERDEKKLTNGKVETIKKGSSFYNKILKEIGNKASSYDGLNDSSIKRLYFPTVLFIKDGKIVKMHEGSVESQMDPLKGLTDSQEEELKRIYIEGFEMLYGEVCDEKC